MHPEVAYQLFSAQLTPNEELTVKRGKGGLSYYKHGVFVCHFNAQPQKKRPDLGFADFRYDVLREYLDVEKTIEAMKSDAPAEVHLVSHKLWCSLHFPLSQLEQIADLFSRHIISKVNIP